jgi:hypothetical protein
LKSDSSTSLERLVHLFGYAICSFERPQISMRFAIRISKGITLSLLLSYSVVKEPTSAKGRQSCQTPTSVSSGLVPFPMNPTRLTRTRLLSRICFLEKISGPELLAACRDRRFYVPGRRVVNYREFHGQPDEPADYFTPRDLRQPLDHPRYSIRLLHNLLCRFELRLVFQRSRTAQGSARTTLPKVLFHRFRRVNQSGSSLTPRQLRRSTTS